MSLSRQKNRSVDGESKVECPSCGTLSMTWGRGTTTTADGIRVSGVARWVCANCQEELYDKTALAKIQAVRRDIRVAA